VTRQQVTVRFPDEPALRNALGRLGSSKAKARVVAVRSGVPLSGDLADIAPTRKSRAHVFGIAGGIGGGLAGWLLALFTAKAYPIITGHMPLVAAPTSGIVVYEGIALGAVLATTFCVLLEGGLLSRKRGPAAPASGTTATLSPNEIEIVLEADDAASLDSARRLHA
jgi:hypothetical protein